MIYIFYIDIDYAFRYMPRVPKIHFVQLLGTCHVYLKLKNEKKKLYIRKKGINQMKNKTIYNSTAANKAQEEYCTKNKLPHFAPTRYCYRCGRDIYSLVNRKDYSTGISVESAGNHLITGCPHCNYSFCE